MIKVSQISSDNTVHVLSGFSPIYSSQLDLRRIIESRPFFIEDTLSLYISVFIFILST